MKKEETEAASVTIEYTTITREQFEDAKILGIKRWKALAEVRNIPSDSCQFCNLFGHGTIKLHKLCPIWDGKVSPSSCCIEWLKWSMGGMPSVLALPILNRIKALDWNTWINELKTGVHNG